MPRPSRVSPDRILLAAAGEFATRGFAGARVDRIARLARVNKAMLYYHFGSKQGLYDALLRRTFSEAAARIRAIAASAPPPAVVAASPQHQPAAAKAVRAALAAVAASRAGRGAAEGEAMSTLVRTPPLARIFLAAALLSGAWACREKAPLDRVRVSGQVEATDVQVSSQVAGRVLELRVSEGDRVAHGDL